MPFISGIIKRMLLIDVKESFSKANIELELLLPVHACHLSNIMRRRLLRLSLVSTTS
jgi:hypothetical protein